ncbi:hypothetical protein ANN_26135 [Periplaneta americana]|uniref:Uncharacterized protein n=1 Tax=Periplaneta americana TaxID=6978 RepID=A0ABQ8S539_PERAM|nr:hypothetical protein ANN_26135 [Periplaneta americana]
MHNIAHKGKGVIMYAECPTANSWMFSKKPLSTSEYVNAVKLSCNLIPVRSVPVRSFNTTRCRHTDCNETETIGHVLEFCRKSELLRNNRHHRVRTSIAEVLRHFGCKVCEEVHCISAADSNRRADIIDIDRVKDKAMVLDLTIRFERNLSQADEVNKEKQEIYEPCLPFLSSKYNISVNQWVVKVALLVLLMTRQWMRDDLRKSEVVSYQSIWHVPRRPSFVYLASTAAHKTKEPRSVRLCYPAQIMQTMCTPSRYRTGNYVVFISARDERNSSTGLLLSAPIPWFFFERTYNSSRSSIQSSNSRNDLEPSVRDRIFICCKSTTRDPQLYFPPGGRVVSFSIPL